MISISHRRSLALLMIVSALFLLACRTANLLGGAEPTITRAHTTRAAQRPTFTPIPLATQTPPPTETPEPTEAPPPTDEPTEPPPTKRPPTKRPPTAVPPTQPPPPPTAQPSPTVFFMWTTAGNASCDGGSDTESSVSGKITANNKGAVGQRVQASSGAGGSPISDNPAESNKDGNYKVTFICGNKACNGDFWIWMVDPNGRQISPFVKFHFDGGCRKGTQNFQKR
jgi:outer membrane biosynthesis protein TonB